MCKEYVNTSDGIQVLLWVEEHSRACELQQQAIEEKVNILPFIQTRRKKTNA